MIFGALLLLRIILNSLSQRIKKKQQGDKPDIRTEEGFTLFYEAYVNYTYYICLQHLKDKDACQDIVSKIFSSIWERRLTLYEAYLNHDGEWRHYLARSAKYKIIDHLRRQERDKNFIEVTVNTFETSRNSTEEAISFNELEGQLAILVNELPNKCKQVFHLSREEGLANREIASQLAISENTVRVHLTKALGHLRVRLKDIFSTPD